MALLNNYVSKLA